MSSSERVTFLGQKGDFRTVVKESVRNSIQDLLSKDAMEALVSFVPPDLLATSPSDFHTKLSEILHDGAEILEYLVLKDLAERLGIKPPAEDDFDIVEFMRQGRTAFGGKAGTQGES